MEMGKCARMQVRERLESGLQKLLLVMLGLMGWAVSYVSRFLLHISLFDPTKTAETRFESIINTLLFIMIMEIKNSAKRLESLQQSLGFAGCFAVIVKL